MFDRGAYFESVKAGGGLVRPEGWSDPDDVHAVADPATPAG